MIALERVKRPHCDDRMLSSHVTELINEFEDDVRYGCHSTRAEASRSLAGKKLVALGAIMHHEVLAHLDALLEKEQTTAVEEGVREGWYSLLLWYCKDMTDAIPKNLPAIVDWLRMVTTH